MRILFYSHDSYGLGHIRRTLSIAKHALKNIPDATGLILTGAPRAHYFDYPDGCDYLKMPSVTKSEAGEYVSRELDLSLTRTVSLRSALIEQAVLSFEPDVLLVDHTPIGLCGELEPLLSGKVALRKPMARVFGMRDVIDAPEKVISTWGAQNVVARLRSSYDRILVYGQQDLFDPTVEYRLPADVTAKTTFTGYIKRNGAKTKPSEIRSQFAPKTGTLVTVTAGGGGDGYPLMREFLRDCERTTERPFEALLLTGPLMSPRKRNKLLRRARALEGVRVVDYWKDVPALYRASNLVVAMGGYNTICELACAGTRALIVPRVFPREEQAVRAARLQGRGLIDVVLPDRIDSGLLGERVLRNLSRPAPPRRWGLDFNGLERVSTALTQVVASPFRPGTAREPFVNFERGK